MTGVQMLQSVIYPIQIFLRKNSIDDNKAKWLNEYLDKTVPFFSSPIFDKMVFPELQRVTINKRLFKGDNIRLTEIRHLKYPKPEQILKNGRANFIGQSILYATLNPITALNEMKPEIGDLITTTWRQKENLFLVVSAIFKKTSLDNITHNELSYRFKISYENELRQHAKNTAEQIDLLLQFIADCFAKEVDYDNNYDYFLSAYYANKILYQFNNGKIGALVYPSAADGLEFSNLAIKPEIFDSHFEPYEVVEGVVSELPSAANNYGYIINTTGKANSFKNEFIIWK